ncbi:MAG: hypothetical protein IJW65_04470, partial [Clostridia bacterium]|nr:hypothetical protein [Clostridia bacterium]
MKKHLRYFTVCFVMIMTLLALIACENESNEGTTEGDTTPPASHVCEGNEWVVTVEPTCIAAGKRQKICECGEVIEVEDISALGHTAGDGATCTSPQLCTVCRTVLVNALGHRAGASATCVSAQVCTVCNTELAITYAHTPGAPATCTTAQICELCGAKLVEALGHTAGPEATCTSSQNCTVCEAELVPPIGHDASEKASCTSPQVCNRCDSVLEEPHGHIEGEPVIDDVVEPTCVSYGSWYETVYCTECDEMLLHYWRKGDYAEHNVVDHYCTECGNMICSEGLEIEYSGSGYYVKGLGTCTDEDVYIGYYKNAPVSRVNLLDSACEKNVKNIYIDVQSLYIDNIYIPSLETLSVDAKIVLRTDVFIGCKRLKSLTLGPKVEGYRAFSDIGFELIEIINHSTSELGLSSGHALEIHDGPSRIVNQDGFLFYTYESTNYLVGYNGDGDIVLPESYNGESYAIYDCAFYGNDDIVELTIPDAVTEIG